MTMSHFGALDKKECQLPICGYSGDRNMVYNKYLKHTYVYTNIGTKNTFYFEHKTLTEHNWAR